MKKCKACGNVMAEGTYCSRCGEKLEEGEVGIKDTPSIFLKYADFLDDGLLYKIAVGKASGVVAGAAEEAAEIFRLLAFRGHTESMYRYAEICLAQNPPDKDTAYHWLKIAADAGHQPSRLLLMSEKVPLSEIGGQRRNERITYGGGVVGSNFEALVADSLPAIVSIAATEKSRGRGKRRTMSLGSGFIVEGGYVVTNSHVVGRDPEYVSASFEPSIDDKTYSLLPLVVEPRWDVAILKFTGLAADRISNRRQLSLRLQDIGFGEQVYTVGNPLGIGLSVSQGIVSCPDRESKYPAGVSTVIQTDITINHGNSGGALLDTANNVIGMVTYKPGNSEGGMGMCVPAEYIVKALNSVRR